MMSCKQFYIFNLFQDDDEVDSKTMVQYSDCDSGTLVPDRQSGGTLVASALVEELGTMVINSDPEDESTMKSECFLALGSVI